MTVVKVTVLFRPFIMHCIVPCCIPEPFPNGIKINFSFFSKTEIRFANGIVYSQSAYLRRQIYLPICILTNFIEKYRKVYLHNA